MERIMLKQRSKSLLRHEQEYGRFILLPSARQGLEFIFWSMLKMPYASIRYVCSF
jgi:hypothetical protein